MKKTHFKRLNKLKKWFYSQGQYSLYLALGICLTWGYAALAKQGYDRTANPRIDDTPIKVALDTIWVLFTACLVFFMNAGFAMLESGFCRYKNALNVLTKNLIVFALASIAFWVIGFAFMFGDGNGFIGWHGFLLIGDDNSPSTLKEYEGIFGSLDRTSIPLQAKFFFQLVFAGTAATIVSGAVAERVKFLAFIVFSLILVGFIYPVVGHWVWGGGWLQELKFWDFAGSTVVHSVGGCAGLIGAYVLGPRKDKYDENGITYTILGHNYGLATLGCFILWLGWFGFNSGSTMEAEPARISHIFLTTNTSIVFGAIAANVTYWLKCPKGEKLSDLSMIINGVLGGAVAITASCPYVSLPSAAFIGIIAGIIVFFGVNLLDKRKIDDPVGAIPVHLFCGIWGTLAVALFSEGGGTITGDLLETGKLYAAEDGPVRGLLLGNFTGEGFQQLMVQLLGIGVIFAFVAGCSWAIWSLMKVTRGIRVKLEEEEFGLDKSQHGHKAYGGFVVKDELEPSAFKKRS